MTYDMDDLFQRLQVDTNSSDDADIAMWLEVLKPFG